MGPDGFLRGVQRIYYSIVEGATVVTKYKPVKTDHILCYCRRSFPYK